MVYKKHDYGSYTLHTIKTDKFKLVHMEIIFRNNAQKENITKRNILFDLLTDSNNEYKTKRDLTLKLEDLYSAYLYSVTSKVGNAHITSLCMDFINPKYTEKTALENSLRLPFEMIFNPLAVNREFDPKLVEMTKERALDNINAIKESPKKYALMEAIKTLGEDSPSSYSNVGFSEDIAAITPASLYEYYEEVLNHDYIDIYIVGDLDMDKVDKIIAEEAKFDVIKNHDFKLYVQNNKRKPVIKSDKFVYIQTTIVTILNLNKLTSYEQKYVANLYNMILGGGSLETKLYKKLRGENSLCYNVGSMYQKYDGLIIITTSVDVNNEAKAIKLIKETIKDMTDKITDTELNQAGELIISSLKMNMDNIGKVVDNYFYKDISDLDDYETRITEFKKVTANEIYNLSKKVSISTIYSLVGDSKI